MCVCVKFVSNSIWIIVLRELYRKISQWAERASTWITFLWRDIFPHRGGTTTWCSVYFLLCEAIPTWWTDAGDSELRGAARHTETICWVSAYLSLSVHNCGEIISCITSCFINSLALSFVISLPIVSRVWAHFVIISLLFDYNVVFNNNNKSTGVVCL